MTQTGSNSKLEASQVEAGQLIRVTAVLNYFKEPWYITWMLKEISKAFKDCGDIEKAKKFALSKMKKASEDGQGIGTNVDENIKSNPFDPQISFKKDNAEVASCIQAYKKWLLVYKPKSIIPCTRLFATIEGQEVTGEPDLMVDDVLVDIKCSSRISQSYWIQVNMYMKLRNIVAGKVGILRLDKETGSFEYEVRDYDASLVDVWIGLMRAYMLFNKEELDGDNGTGSSNVREDKSEKALA